MLSPSEGVLSVSQLARRARLLIEEHLGAVTVEGEISNFRRPASGHWYFTLKDPDAQIRCAMFAGRNRLVRLSVRDGLSVRLTGRVSLYEPRGDFQLLVERMLPAGEGALRAAFEALKERLASEGLFEAARKRPLPAHPRHLTIITSPDAAALRDVLHVIERRFPGLEVLLIPTAVQGESAEPQLLRALELAAARPTDVVLLTRGGGSLEDLWAFNLESVARAVSQSPHPVVSAIGHQTDFAITDFVADVRAPTPSAAAELITPTRAELAATLNAALVRLRRAADHERRFRSLALHNLRARLIDPASTLALRTVQVDDLAARSARAWQVEQQRRRADLQTAARSLALLAPGRAIVSQRRVLGLASRRLATSTGTLLSRKRFSLAGSARALAAVSPLATLERGYSVLTRATPEGERQPLTSIRGADRGAELTALLADGSLTLEVRDIDPVPPLVAPEPRAS